MTPVFAAHDFADSRIADAKFLGDREMRSNSAQRPDTAHIFLSQLRESSGTSIATLVESGSPSVTTILKRRRPLKVVWSIVGLAAVLVIDLMLRSRRKSKECFCDKAMEVAPSTLPVHAKPNTNVPIFIDGATEYSSNVGRPMRFDTTQTAKVTDLKPPFCTSNGAPIFPIYHVTIVPHQSMGANGQTPAGAPPVLQ